jgi:hypothetical protein
MDSGEDRMAMQSEVDRHRQGWISFTQFIKWGTGIVVLILVLMAIFLL